MQKFFYLLIAVVIFIVIQTEPAYCRVSRTMTLKISATIPEHVMTNNNLGIIPFSNNPNQLVQTQTVIRDNKIISLTSIVVP